MFKKSNEFISFVKKKLKFVALKCKQKMSERIGIVVQKQCCLKTDTKISVSSLKIKKYYRKL